MCVIDLYQQTVVKNRPGMINQGLKTQIWKVECKEINGETIGFQFYGYYNSPVINVLISHLKSKLRLMDSIDFTLIFQLIGYISLPLLHYPEMVCFSPSIYY